MDVPVFAAGNYRYIKAVFQYSGGVAAEPGYEIERARFAKPLPLADAYAAVEAHLKAIGRPTAAFAACELRTPAPFTDQGFIDFNKVYVKTLARWGIYQDGEVAVNPVARTNVCPLYDKPKEPVMYAFSYTVASPRGSSARRSFVLAGGGEAADKGAGKTYAERIVRLGDTSPEGMREKVSFVIAEMERRLKLLGFSWSDAVTTQAYTVQNIGHLVGELLASRGAANGGLVWYYARPPVIGLEYEMDVRGAARELVL
ncbi:MAG: hypothetical protein NTW47_14405 [Proteobacteria bacterium]|jgi:hypothetical protein|nr:hypothetical protein [Pseudomonadota bacterium]